MAHGEAEWRLETTRSGHITAFWKGRALHSRFDPVREARRAAAVIPRDAGLVVLGGIGLGYVAESLVGQHPRLRLVIAEANPVLAGRAMGARDLSGLFGRSEVSLFTGGDPEEVKNLLSGLPVGLSVHYIQWKPSADTDPDWYRRLEAAVRRCESRRAVNARTLERFSGLWVRNLAANTGAISRALSLAEWEDYLRDFPALVLAGGPSLDSILPLLRELALRHLVIAVDTALPAAIRAGVVPDIVAAVDPQYWNTRHLDRCAGAAGSALVLAEASTHPAVFRRLPGRPWLTRSRFPMGTVLEDAGGIRGELKAGGSVSAAAWDLARHLGCRPMTIAGLDLGFPGGRTHYSGSLAGQRPHFYSRRCAPAQTQSFLALRSGSPYMSKDSAGRRLLTDRRMDVYHTWFTESVAGLFNRMPSALGDRGRRIDRMGQIDLRELMDRPVCRGSLNEFLAELRNSPGFPNAEQRIKEAVEELDGSLSRMERLALSGRHAAVKAQGVVRNGGHPEQELRAMKDIDGNLLAAEGLDVVSFLLQPIIAEFGSDRSGADSDPLRSSERLYSEIAESAAFHRRHLKRNLPD